MPATLESILGADGAIARRLAGKYEFRPQQLEMAQAAERAFVEGHHLLVEAGTGVGKSFAYLLPAIDYAVRQKKRVVISTHTISLQEQLIDKDIPLLQSVYPDEFTAVLVKGRNNYLCQRRLEQAKGRQTLMFEQDRQLESLWTLEQWAARTTDGSLADLPSLPDNDVWDKVCAEHGNCLGKRCKYYQKCFWQAAKRRMAGGNLLIVNHALFFSDLALRAAGVNYLPKYDLVVLDEAHTVEDVAGQHFGLKVSEAGLRYVLRNLYETRRGRGLLSTYGSSANDAIRDVVELEGLTAEYFEQCLDWHRAQGKFANGRMREPNLIPNELTPRLKDLSKHLRAMLTQLPEDADEDIAELTSRADRVAIMAETLDAVTRQSMEDAVYWMDLSGTGGMGRGMTPRVTLNAAPIDVGEGLRRHLFTNLRSVVMTSATLCAKGGQGPKAEGTARGTGFQPVLATRPTGELHRREGANLPHWTKDGSIYAVTFRLADSLPHEVLNAWRDERDELLRAGRAGGRALTAEDAKRLDELHSEKVERFLDAGHGHCWMNRHDVADLVSYSLKHFEGSRYRLLAWCVMPNHVHAVLQPTEGHELSDILHSWKSYTANEANRLLGRTGEFWQSESYDHLVRDEPDLRHAVEYAYGNADAAGLEDWKWRGQNEESFAALVNATEYVDRQDGLEAHATDEVPASKPVRPIDPAFAYIQARLGVDACHTLQLGSPYDYANQVTLYLETGLPDPNEPRFLPAACQRIVHYLEQTRGGAFVLFTSYKMLIEAANSLKPTLDEMGLPLLVQGQGAPRKILLERFRSTPDAVLFGTSSFWQGIDVQGDALRNVIIVKLPFAVPDEPVTEARLDAIKRSGGNAFMDYSVPEAIIKLKQGFGRLIRSRTDNGIVVILDSRVATKRYGQLFLDALPECRIERVRG